MTTGKVNKNGLTTLRRWRISLTNQSIEVSNATPEKMDIEIWFGKMVEVVYIITLHS